jgi:aldehyde dehydrogenase (NAD+)
MPKKEVKELPRKNRSSKPRSYLNLIDGQWVPARSSKTFKNINPANVSDVIGEFPASGPEDVEAAYQAASRAYPKWRAVPAPKRAEILFRVGQILLERKEELSRQMTREMGKVLKETRGDVQEAIDTAFHHAGEGRRLFGFTTPSELPNKFAMTVRAPVGVCGVITPWNFPMAIPSWKLFPAVVAGNTVVFKPASDTPLSGHALVEIFQEAGLPDGVVNLVHGGGSAVGMPIVRHPGIRVVSFTGSSEVGRQINEIGGRMLKRISCELGGKNAQVVMEDADLDLALEGAVWGAFGTTGQRCTATSRIIVHRKVHDAFVSRLVERAAKLKLGDGLVPGVDVGPVVNEGRIPAIQKYVDLGVRQGCKMLCGGRRETGGELKKGFFYQPTVFDAVKPTHAIAQEEIFGPVTAVLTVDSFDEAMQVLNGTAYGLSSSLYTRDVRRAFRYMEATEHGVAYVNAPTIGAEAHLPFGGFKDTGNGHREGSHQIYEVFTEWKTIFVDYSGTLQKAQIDEPGKKE